MGGLGSGYRGDRKPWIEQAFCLDLGDPHMHAALAEPMDSEGSFRWGSNKFAQRQFYLGPSQGNRRDLVVRPKMLVVHRAPIEVSCPARRPPGRPARRSEGANGSGKQSRASDSRNASGRAGHEDR